MMLFNEFEFLTKNTTYYCNYIIIKEYIKRECRSKTAAFSFFKEKFKLDWLLSSTNCVSIFNR
jgi:hypothetical protein